jgi:hypothetical protein
MGGRRAAVRREYASRSPARGAGRAKIRRSACQPPILNIFVPHTGQVPWVAGFPFFIVIFCSLVMSRFALHFTQ